MKNVLVIFLLLISTLCFGQFIEGLPFDEKGELNFNGVEAVDNETKDVLYLRAKQFFVDYFNSANHVIQMDDKEAGIIIGKGRGEITIRNLGIPHAVEFRYSIKIQCKDGRYKYEVYDISYMTYETESLASQVYQPKDIFSKEKYYKKNGEPRDIPEKYKEETKRKVEETVLYLKGAMTSATSTQSKKDDWE